MPSRGDDRTQEQRAVRLAAVILTPSHLARVLVQMAAKNILKGELKRRGVTYAKLAERVGDLGVHESERNLNNKSAAANSRPGSSSCV